MVNIVIDKKEVNVDIRGELEYVHFDKADWRDNKLIACSPFRDDSSPSFFINLEDYDNTGGAGTWGDSGSGETGNFISFLSLLRGLTYEESKQYLLETYYYESTLQELEVSLKFIDKTVRLPEVVYSYSPYLAKRGIGEGVQKEIGVHEDDNYVIMPWKDSQGVLFTKRRYLDKHGFKVDNAYIGCSKDYLFGLYQSLPKKPSTLFITEAEIDAMTIMEMGYCAVATGTSRMTNTQFDLIKSFGLKRIVIATDNDKAGKKFAENVLENLTGFIPDIYRLVLEDCKDVNDYYLKYKRMPKFSKYNNLDLGKMFYNKKLNRSG